MGFLAAVVGIFFPLILSELDENYAVKVGGENLAVVFLLGAPLVGHCLGDLVRSDNDLTAYYKDYGYVFLGVLLGFVGALAIGVYFEAFSEKEGRFYVILGLFGGALMTIFFLANVTDFFKNKELSEERLEAFLRSIGIIGIYQYLFSVYTDALIPFIGKDPDIDPLIGFPMTLIYMAMLLLLALFFLKDLRTLIPDFIVAWAESKFAIETGPENDTIQIPNDNDA